MTGLDRVVKMDFARARGSALERRMPLRAGPFKSDSMGPDPPGPAHPLTGNGGLVPHFAGGPS